MQDFGLGNWMDGVASSSDKGEARWSVLSEVPSRHHPEVLTVGSHILQGIDIGRKGSRT